MAERTHSAEWPLVVFTLAIQLSCGLVLALTLCGTPSTLSVVTTHALGIAAFPIALLGILASMLHLGRPWLAWRSLANLPKSRLSVEVLLTGLYAASCATYSSSWWSSNEPASLALGITTSVLGLAAVISSAFIYMVPSQPAWNSKWILGSFVGTTLVLGGTAYLTLAQPTASGRFTIAPVLMMISGALLVLASAGRMLTRANQTSGREVGSVMLSRPYLFLASLHIVLAGLFPIAAAAIAWFSPAVGELASGLIPVSIITAVSGGAILGRMLMYSLVRQAF